MHSRDGHPRSPNQPARATQPCWKRQLAPAAFRLLWIGLLALHLPIAIRAVSGLAHDGITITAAAKFALLMATIVLFALKAVDLPVLRLPTRKATCIVFLLATAIVHHDALAVSDAHVHVTAAAVSTTSLAGIELWRRRRALLRSVQHFLQTVTGTTCAPLQQAAFDDRARATAYAPNAFARPHQPIRAPPIDR